LCLLLLSSLGMARAQSPAPEFHLGRIEVSGLRAPPTPPGAGVAAVYLSITNGGSKADRLLAIRSPIAAKAEIHSTTMTAGIMQMRLVEFLDLPPGVPIKIEPGAIHIMLQGLTHPLEPGSTFPLTLEFRDAGMLVVQVPVKAALE